VKQYHGQSVKLLKLILLPAEESNRYLNYTNIVWLHYCKDSTITQLQRKSR